MAPPRPAVALVLACAAAAAGAVGCGGKSDEEQVRETLTQFAQATAAKDYQTMCDRLLAPDLVDEVERIGLPCEVALQRGLGDVKRPRLVVGKVRIDGSQANAEVRTSAAGQEPSRDVVKLVKSGDGWRISSLATPSSPSPAP